MLSYFKTRLIEPVQNLKYRNTYMRTTINYHIFLLCFPRIFSKAILRIHKYIYIGGTYII